MAEPFPGEAALAPLRIRLAALVYEALLLAALLIAATAIFVAVAGDSRAQPLRLALQVYLLSVAAVYFVWSWSGGRRTLAMRTWRLRLVDARGNPPDARTALVRFLVLVLSLPIGAAAFWWALVDRDRLYLHDRVAGTRLVRDPRSAFAGRARTRA
jgi:uncharacterized RDD family membrane protein YckC